MSEPDSPSLSRRTVLGAAWAAPVIVAAVAAPLAAASTGGNAITARISGPTEFASTQGTLYQVFYTNSGTEPILTGDLTVYLPLSGQGWQWQGFGGIGWDYAPGGITVSSYTFRYNGMIAAGQEAGLFYFIVGSDDRSQSPQPTAKLTAMAPGFDPSVLALPIPY